MNSKEYIKGTIKTIVLKLLAENDKMYGYEINQRVKQLSGGELELSYGALYPILYKLENEGLLRAQSDVVDGRARKYYSLTVQGNETARVKVAELNKFVEVIKAVIAPYPKPSLELWGY